MGGESNSRIILSSNQKTRQSRLMGFCRAFQLFSIRCVITRLRCRRKKYANQIRAAIRSVLPYPARAFSSHSNVNTFWILFPKFFSSRAKY